MTYDHTWSKHTTHVTDKAGLEGTRSVKKEHYDQSSKNLGKSIPVTSPTYIGILHCLMGPPSPKRY